MAQLAGRLSLGPVAPGPLSAGGTVNGAGLSPARRVWLGIEMVLIFVAAPLVMYQTVHGERVPLFLALLPVLTLALVLLAADRSFSLMGEARRGIGWRTALSIVLLFLVLGGAVAAWVQHTHPGWIFEFPRRNPKTYWRIMLLYPIMSVAAQELVYRTFYFHRYGRLFGQQRWLGITLNAVLFGFGHVVVGTGFAIAATFMTGLLFALRYAATRSFWAVFIEHTLWGWLVFTIGLGRYFFTGVSNV